MPLHPLKTFTRICGISDLFKYKFFFRIGTSIENSTCFSIFFSLLVITPLLVYFLLLANTTLKHNSAKINVQEFDVNQRPYLNLNEDNFRMAFRIILANTSSFSADINEYFDFVLYYTTANQTNSTFSLQLLKPFQLETCQEKKFEDFQDYYNLNLRDAFCLVNHSMDIGGYWDEDQVGWFTFEMASCGTIINKTNCKSPDIVENELKSSYFYVYIESQDVDSTNYSSPMKKSMKTYFQMLDFKVTKDFYFYMEKVQLNTYDNMIYNTNPEIQYFNKQMSMVSDFTMRIDPTDIMVVQMLIFSSNKIQQIERTYMTLVEAAAVVGGVSSFVIVLGTMITFLYNDMKLKLKLINKLYTFDCDNNNTQQQIQEKKENVQLFLPDKKKSIFTASEMKKSTFKKLFHKSQIDALKLKAKQASESEIIIPDEVTKDDGKNFPSLQKSIKKFVAEPFSITEENKITKGDILENLETNNPLKNIEIDRKSFQIELADLKGEHNKKSKEIAKDEEQKQNFIESSYIKDKKNVELNDMKKEKSKKNNSKLKFSTCELIMCILIPFALPHKLKNKFRLYEKACEYLMKYINIFYLIRMVDDVQKLKSILLNNQQIALFNYISKPIIKLQDDENVETHDNYLSNLEKVFMLANNNDTQNEEIILEIMGYYQELKLNGAWSLIDARLFDYLDENFKKTLKLSLLNSNKK